MFLIDFKPEIEKSVKIYSCKISVNYIFENFCFIQSISKHMGFLNVFDQFQEKMREVCRNI